MVRDSRGAAHDRIAAFLHCHHCEEEQFVYFLFYIQEDTCLEHL